ncbi:TIGR00730 family Rossman fold protein [Methylibium sp. Pch-M]|uniref:LOG family protein n=1 Tax=Methylibium sp. Pch-M TaxID=2082386 RepID=UPI00101372CB|nr:TIGR00730 family Rossman fold protein [Methylibium sp. Pch-M]QAZ41006.1 TIGR00730 family Rossman fold protein [Methylibium sp. Pch-M]
MTRRFTLCVYCGSRPGDDPAHAHAARAVGREIAQRGWQLVYGGGNVGLMGIVADAALAGGAPVIGVIPRSLMEREVGHPGLSELHVVETMHQRKQGMAERADAFLALPGGIGTFEELFEVWTWRQLGYHDQPIGLLNVGGYYDALVAFMQQTVDAGFVSDGTRAMLEIGDEPSALLDRLAAQAALSGGRDDYSRT